MLIENSTFVSTCNALKVGTDTQGDFRNIIVRNVTLGGVPEGEETIAGRQSSTGITLATVDGGHVHDVLIQNATINQARCPIFIRIGNRGRVIPGVEKPVPGTLKHIVIENVSGERNFRQGSLISGIYNAPVEDIVIRNYQIKMEGGGGKELIYRTVLESEAGYPDAHKFLKDGLPSYGFFLRHAQGVTIQNASVATESRDERPELSNGGDVSNSVYNDITIH
jgi:polygalacturonase